jgi:hypothetical protein
MWYIVKRNAFGDYLFWHAHHKNFRYSGGSSYASLDGAKKAFSAIISTYNISPVGVEVVSHEAVLNNYNKVTGIA